MGNNFSLPTPDFLRTATPPSLATVLPLSLPIALVYLGIVPSLTIDKSFVAREPVRRKRLADALGTVAFLKMAAESYLEAQGNVRASAWVFATTVIALPLRKLTIGMPRPSPSFALFWFYMGAAQAYLLHKLRPLGSSPPNWITKALGNLFIAGCVAMGGVEVWMWLYGRTDPSTLARRPVWGASPAPSEAARHHRRRRSVMTATLATGAFPKDSGIPMPTTQHILWFEVLPPLPAVRQVLVDHFAPHRRFHSVPYVSKEGEVEWESEGGFSLDYHIHTLTLPSESAILSYVSSLFPASSFGRGKPLWNVSLLRNEGEGKSAIVVNVALVVGDVSSFLEVLVGGLTDAHGSPLSPSHLRTVLRPSLPPTSLSALSHLPAYTSAHLRVLRKQLSPPDHATSIKPAHDPYIYTAQREIVLCPAVEFDTVKEIQKGLEAKLGVKVTVSEVLTAAVSGAVRRYLVARGDEVLKREGKNVRTRALLPFAYREARPAPPTTPGAPAPTDLDGYSNRWSFLSINLPVGEPDPLERVRKCKTELDLKRVLPEAAAQANVQRWTMGVVPEEIAGKTNLEGFTRHTLVLANVPFHHPSFPPGPLFFAGEPVISMHPVISSALPTATLFTYAGMLSANFVVDPEEWKDHESVGGFWVEELGELASVVGVSVGEDA